MYSWFFIFSLMVPLVIVGQTDSLTDVEIDHVGDDRVTILHHSNAKFFRLFSSGEIDYISGGMLLSSARVVEVNIGDPDRFYLPLYIMAGATTRPTEDGFGINALAAADLLNTDGGIMTIGTYSSRNLKIKSKNTKAATMYQFAVKSLSGIATELEENVSLISKMLAAGLTVETKAWKSDQLPADGKAWFKVYLSYSINDKQKIHRIFGCHSDHHFTSGNLECGIDIKDFLAVKFGYHTFLSNRHIEDFAQSMYLFSADFALSSH